MDGGLVKRIVLTGGPCGGKSTVQTILSDIFQNLGWKVFRVPETATVLLRYILISFSLTRHLHLFDVAVV